MSRLKDKCILALDVGGTSIKYALVPLSKKLTLHSFGELPVNSEGSIKEVEDSYRKVLRTARQKANNSDMVIKGLGVSTPGPFDYNKGIYLMDHKFSSMYGRSIIPALKSELPDSPLRFIHDSHAFLLGESLHPIYSTYVKPCAVMLGTGLGFALMENNTILCNEIGGPKVSIFKRPYLESIAEEYVSKRGIMNIYKELGGDSSTSIKEMEKHAYGGDEKSIKTFEQTGWHMANIISPIIEEQSIDCVILGGQISKANELIINPMKRRFEEISIDCFVGKAQNIDSAPLFGIAQLFEEV